MIIRIGETSAKTPDGQTVEFKVIQALDPLFEMPVAQIMIPKGEQCTLIGKAIAGDDDPGKLIVPDFIPPEDMRPGDGG